MRKKSAPSQIEANVTANAISQEVARVSLDEVDNSEDVLRVLRARTQMKQIFYTTNSNGSFEGRGHFCGRACLRLDTADWSSVR